MNRVLTRFGVFVVLASFLTWVAVAKTASAHPVLVPKPTETLADRILRSESLLLAREDPQRPFHYVAVDTVMGDPGTAPIEIFMPSNLRRRLAMDPDLAVLLSRTAPDAQWRAHGVATADYLQVVQQILSFADDWTPNETDNLPRLQEFSALLGHKDLRLHELAYIEIGRATYASIRRVSVGVPLERVRRMLADPFYADWRGLDIMLLGLSDEQRDQAMVIYEMEQRQRLSMETNLAAWATAYVEIKGTDGIDQLEEWYFQDSMRSREELRSIARALAGHANEAEELREPVVAAYRELLSTHPYAAPDISHDLIAWRRWDLFERMRELQPRIAMEDPLGVYKVDLYLQRARAANRAE